MKELSYTTLIESLQTSDDKQKLEIANKLSKDCNVTIPLLWSKAISQDNPRTILSIIRDLIKKEQPRIVFKRITSNSIDKIISLLNNSDPKVRKNVCGIISEIGDPEYLEALYDSYSCEQQLFVKSSYVLAIGNCGKASDGEKLKKILEDILIKEKTCQDKSSLQKNQKHINEEKLALTKAIAKLSPTAYHEFKGFKKNVPMILTAMNEEFKVTLGDLKEKSISGKLVNEGVLIQEKDLNKIYSCRTFYELLFPLDGCKNLQLDYRKIADAIIKSHIVDFLNMCHENTCNDPFCYRIEFKTMNFSREKSEFVKNLSIELDKLANGNLRNSPSSYEVEIRIVENKKLCNVFLKLYSYKDTRFDYRYKDLPTSINPVTAAIVMKSISKWLKPDAKVIDPFCGTGTMLIERAKLKSFSALTGVDIYRTAISAAEINSNLANVDIKLIAEDILEFTVSEKFDEVITNMPFESKSGTHDFDKNLYCEFINKIPKLVKPGGMLFLYTVEKNLLKENLTGNSHLKVIDEIKMESGSFTPHVFVIKVE